VLPGAYLKEGSDFDQNEQVWFWENEGTKLFYEKGQKIKVRLVETNLIRPKQNSPEEK
jgi:DNA-directed RNA polymerase subunit E'/Rpb7